MRTLYASTLTRLGACAPEVELFRQRFGDSVDVTESTDTAGFSIEWAARYLLSPTAYADYARSWGVAYADYERIRGAARAAYADYVRIRGAASADYVRIEKTAWADYEHIRGAAWAGYVRIRDAAFLHAYLNDKEPVT